MTADVRGQITDLLDRLDAHPEKVTRGDVALLTAAVRAVLVRHERIATGSDAGFCTGCDMSWPCPTHRDLAAALLPHEEAGRG